MDKRSLLDKSMSYPSIRFVDVNGTPFNPDEDGLTHVRQFGGAWYVELDRAWQGEVALDGTPPILLIQVPNTNRWELPPGRERVEIIRRSGEVTVVLIDSTGKVARDTATTLHIYPANISEWQIDRMVSDIGVLALSTAWCVRRLVPVPMGEGFGAEGLGQQWIAGNGMIATATALLELAAVVQDNWSAIQKRPLKSFVTEVGPVGIGKANLSPQLLIKSKVEPGKRRVLGMTRIESTQCMENEFLCYILDVYLLDLASGLITSLESLSLINIEDDLIPAKPRRKDEEFQEFIEASKQRIQTFRLRQEELKKQINCKILQLQSCVQWATQSRSSNFLVDIKTPDEPVFNSLRLIASPNYGPIFEKYSNSKGDILEPIQKVLYLLEHIYRGEIQPTWEIYETWCVVKLYSAFILYANMQPLDERQTLFESIEVEPNGTLKLPRNTPFSLRGKLSNGQFYTIHLIYEAQLTTADGQLRTPDIIIRFSINEETNNYCFDAKYRNYDQQGDGRLIEDVIDIARDRYLEELPLACAFILHTDPKRDYWGEVPFHRLVLEEFDVEMNELEYPGHQYGAIVLVPGNDDDRQVRRILRLLFQYHNSELCTACLSCGQQLEWGNDVHSSWKPDRISEEELIGRVVYREGRAGNGTGLYCSCPQCGSFWVIQSCYGEHHHLLKFKDCFHRNSDHPEFQGKWMYICPDCGSDPSLAELRATAQQAATNLDF
ncbi:MAG: hypothetical protein KME13_21260 [Myxacorys californica WJT36-NPBG1]|jgi:hypothetical protein|nr:hypothetical protein [Myxacorys californica WJT36-NPBG1]